MVDEPERRCGTCARFVRVIETIDETGEVRRHGECLLGVWPSPLYDTSTCSQWVRRGEFKAKPRERPSRTRSPRGFGGASRGPGTGGGEVMRTELVLPEDLLDMDADEFRRVLSEVIRDELGTGDAQIAGKWEGGEVVLRPGKPGVQEKRIPI
ncbi:MAG TPA: hypothetical protein VIY73_05955, partial [Polyangiaceae bacterium]